MTYIQLRPQLQQAVVDYSYSYNSSNNSQDDSDYGDDDACIDTNRSYYKNCQSNVITAVADALNHNHNKDHIIDPKQQLHKQKQETIRTSRRKQDKKRVRFQPVVTYQPVEEQAQAQTQEDDEEEDSDSYISWYTRKELKSFKADMISTIHWMVMNGKNGSKVDDSCHRYYCTRGIECRTPVNRVLRQQRRSQSIKAVLYSQQKQRRRRRRRNYRCRYSYDDDDELSFSSSSCSSSSSDSSCSSSSSSSTSSLSTMLLTAVSSSSSLSSLLSSFTTGDGNTTTANTASRAVVVVEEEENEYYRQQRRQSQREEEEKNNTREIAKIYASYCIKSSAIAYCFGTQDEFIATQLYNPMLDNDDVVSACSDSLELSVSSSSSSVDGDNDNNNGNINNENDGDDSMSRSSCYPTTVSSSVQSSRSSSSSSTSSSSNSSSTISVSISITSSDGNNSNLMNDTTAMMEEVELIMIDGR